MGTCEINEVSLSCFDNKIFVLNKGDDGLAIKILLIFSLVRRAFSILHKMIDGEYSSQQL